MPHISYLNNWLEEFITEHKVTNTGQRFRLFPFHPSPVCSAHEYFDQIHNFFFQLCAAVWKIITGSVAERSESESDEASAVD